MSCANRSLCLSRPRRAGLFETLMLPMRIFSPKELSMPPPAPAGQGLVEYALIMLLVAIIVIVIVALLGPSVGNLYSNVMANF